MLWPGDGPVRIVGRGARGAAQGCGSIKFVRLFRNGESNRNRLRALGYATVEFNAVKGGAGGGWGG